MLKTIEHQVNMRHFSLLAQVLSEEERTETLAALRLKKEELETALQKLPLKINSEMHKQRERDFQTKLNEVEDTIKMFQRPRVLVKIDC